MRVARFITGGEDKGIQADAVGYVARLMDEYRKALASKKKA